MKRVLITGFTGLLGSKVVDELKKNSIYQLIGITRDFTVKRNDIEVIYGEYSDKQTYEKVNKPIDIVIHLASEIYNCNENNIFRSNILPSYLISRYAEIWGCERIIFSSSSAVYGNPTINKIITEDHPLSLDNLYAYSKFVTEKTFIETKTKCINLRFTYLYDTGDNRTRIGRLMGDVKNNVVPKVREEERDLLSTHDAALAIIKSIEYSGLKNTFNIGSSKFVSMNEIVSRLEEITQKEIKPNIIGVKFNYGLNVKLANQELKWFPTKNILGDLSELINNGF